MKKILMLILLLTAYGNIFAFLTQANWRWRNDDGSQTTATWKAAQNTPVTITSTSDVIRLRLEIYNNQTGDPIGLLDTLQYATSAAGPWMNVDTAAGSGAFMLAGSSAFVMQDEATTTQLTGVALTFVPGKIMVDSMVLKNYSLATLQHTEVEWAIKGTANTAPNTTYYFREWGSTANPLDIGVTYPSLKTAGVLPIKLIAFNVNREGKKVKLEWSTASEQNNDRYEIRRSSDGTNWKTISSIKGNGNTTGTSTYTTYDESPLTGNNYYSIKQYDIDGRFSQSIVKLVKMSRLNSLISVYPNPTKSGVNFSLENVSVANMEATLTNMNGSIIHQEIFKNVTINTINKLNLAQQPAPGVYILKLKGQGISENVRVVIE